jgi:adenine-specific DNA-methyltransferase
VWDGQDAARAQAEAPARGRLSPPDPGPAAARHQLVEGDNLEVLKLLAPELAGQVRCVYIDPPYNTGRAFLYADGLSAGDWLGFLYPRLAAARRLLRRDGILLVSIGEGGASRLELLLEEVFGAGNLLGRFVWTYGLSENQAAISAAHEYVFAVARDAAAFGRFRLTAQDVARLGPEVRDACFRPEQRRNPVSELRVPAGVRSDRGGDFTVPAGTRRRGLEFVDAAEFRAGRLVAPVRLRAAWTMRRLCERWFAALEAGEEPRVVDTKGQRLLEVHFSASGRLSYRKARSAQSKVSSHLHGDALTYTRGREAVQALFDGRCPFDYPKPVALVQRLVELSTHDEDVVLDFFAGSGTTAEAVFRANLADGGRRRVVLVELPAPIDADGIDRRAAREVCAAAGVPATLAALTRERVVRAGRAVAAADPAVDTRVAVRRWLPPA